MLGIIVNQLHAQRKYTRHYSFNIFYEQNTSFRILNFGKGVEIQKEWFEERKSTEKPIITNKFGGHLFYHTNHKWAFKSGFQITRYGNIAQPSNLVFEFVPDTLSKTPNTGLVNVIPILTPNTDGTRFRREFFYYEIPISAHYKFYENRFLSFLEFGFLLGVEGKRRVKSITINGGASGKYSSNKPNFNVGIEWLIGFNILEKDKVNIQLSPSFSMYLLNPDRQRFKEYLYAFGLRLQTSFFR